MYYKDMSHHTHHTLLLFDSPPAHCWKVVECFPNERIILKHAGDIEHNNTELSLARLSPPPPPIRTGPLWSTPNKSIHGPEHVLLSVFTGFDYQRQRIGITRICLALYKAQPSFYRAFTAVCGLDMSSLVDCERGFLNSGALVMTIWSAVNYGLQVVLSAHPNHVIPSDDRNLHLCMLHPYCLSLIRLPLQSSCIFNNSPNISTSTCTV